MVQLIKDVVRGTSVTFTATFYDVDGNVITPNTATLFVYHRINDAASTTNTAMVSINATSYAATWDSTGVDPGVISWSIVGQSDDKSVTEGSFRVLAGKATP